MTPPATVWSETLQPLDQPSGSARFAARTLLPNSAFLWGGCDLQYRILVFLRKDARVRLEDARVRREDARVRLEDARVRLEDARARLEDARVRLEDARVRLEDARVRLEDARVRLEDARVRLEDARTPVDFGNLLVISKRSRPNTTCKS